MDKDVCAKSENGYDSTPIDPPPPYELPTEDFEQRQSPSAATGSSWSSRLSHRWHPGHAAPSLAANAPSGDPRPDKGGLMSELRVLYRPANPKKVKCRCSQICDTTKWTPDLPQGQVRCGCGYIVTSTGASFHQAEVPRCDCNLLMQDSTVCETCELWLTPKGNVLKRTTYGYEPASGIVKCACDRLVNVNLVYKVTHLPRDGKGSYNFTLPVDTGRCRCGRTVTRSGSRFTQHTNECCRDFLTIKSEAPNES